MKANKLRDKFFSLSLFRIVGTALRPCLQGPRSRHGTQSRFFTGRGGSSEGFLIGGRPGHRPAFPPVRRPPYSSLSGKKFVVPEEYNANLSPKYPSLDGRK